jgi:glycosyltransferase involved in cell wall biosynthesis
MKILIVTHYFPPEIGAPQTRLSELARLWAEAGEEVTVLTGFPNHPTGVIPPGYRHRLRMEESIDGYRVVRTWLYATPNEGVVRKTVGHLSFMATSLLLGLRATGKADVVVVSSPTFFSMLSARLIARLKRARLVIEVRDLWPAAIAAVGVIRKGRMIRLLETIELSSYRRADMVVPTSHGFADDIASRGIDRRKIEVITNGVDLARFAQPADIEAARRSLRVAKDHVLVLYAGTHGMLYSLPIVAEAAHLLRDELIHFAFVGEGVAKRELAKRVAALGLEKVTLAPGVPGDEIPALLKSADICLLPLRDTAMVRLVIAAKIFEYMGAAKPIVGSVAAETASLLSHAGAVVVPPDNARALARAIRDLAHDPARRQAMGAQARQCAERNYDRAVLAERYRELLGRITRADS